MSIRNSYEAKAAAEFAEIQSHLAALGVRAKEAVATGRAEAERLLVAAQSKHDEALHHFELLKLAGEDKWHSVKSSFETSWAELRHSLGRKG